MLIVFDDQKEFREFYSQSFPKLGIEMEVIECETKDNIRELLKNSDMMQKAKILVFDLSTDAHEVEKQEFDILEDISKSYEHFSIPIFIHSAFADRIDSKYDNLGTLFKIKKSNNSVEEILNSIELFYSSGFLEIFSPGGYLETQIFKEIHRSFNEQFYGDEIKEILKSIKHTKKDDIKTRVKSVFERIAIRSLYQNLLSAKKVEESESISEITINLVEHYYRRKSDFEIWTGDIFENQESGEQVFILTPRCDINNGVCNDRFLVCTIEKLDRKSIKNMSSPDDANKYLTDNPIKSGIRFRYLLPAPNYDGGKIDVSKYYLMTKDELTKHDSKFKYKISLSDELTNEVVRKFSNYIQRGGISASEVTEAMFYSIKMIENGEQS